MRVLTTGHAASVRGLAYAPPGASGRWLASCSADRTVRLWDLDTGECVRTIRAHDRYVYAVAFSPDGSRLVSGSGDHTLRVWDPATGARLGEGRVDDPEAVACLSFHPDGGVLASVGWDVRSSSVNRPGPLRFWEPGRCDGRHRTALPGWSGPPAHTMPEGAVGPGAWWSAAFSPDGRSLAAVGYTGVTRLYDWPSMWVVHSLRFRGFSPQRLAFAPDGSALVLAAGKYLRVVDPASGAAGPRWPAHEKAVTSLACYPADGSWRVLSASADGLVRCWAPDGTAAGTFEWPLGGVGALAVAPDGLTAAAGGEGGRVVVWDLEG